MALSSVIFFLMVVRFNTGDMTPPCCRNYYTSVDVIYNCSHCGFTAMPSIPDNVTVLDLSTNNISIINQTLKNFTQLRKLNLQGNKISSINDTVFYGLNTLTELDVSHNAFQNNFGFPNQAISNLHNLYALDVDVKSDFHFSKEFLNLRKLTVLNLNPVSGGLNLRNVSFEGLQNAKIKQLRIQLHIDMFESGVFSHFPSLTGLTLTNTGLNLNVLLKSLSGLQNRTMDFIDFSHNFVNIIGVKLDADSSKYLQHICVKFLNIRRCYITEVKLDFFKSILNCTEKLIISNNFLGLSPTPLYSYVFQSTVLKYLDASWISRIDPPRIMQKHEYTNISKINENVNFILPKTLRYVNVSFAPMHSSIPNITIIAQGLQVLDFSFAVSFHCDYGRIFGFHNLTIVNITGIDCSKPNPNLLQDATNLTHFVCQKCSLTSEVMNFNFFKGLKHLNHIDLSDNSLKQFDKRMLADQINSLETLILRNIGLDRIPETLTNMQTLNVVDVRGNLIAFISDDDRNLLDKLQNMNQAFSILMDNNPLLCSCNSESLRFLYWLRTSNIIKDKRSLKCSLSNGETVNIMNILNSFEYFQFQCFLQFLIITAGVFVVLLICITLVIRSKYQLKYWFIMKQMSLKRKWQLNENEFEYDVYVSHHEDCVWTRVNLLENLQRNCDIKIITEPEPGKSIPFEIMRAIRSSEKIILVLTNAYLADHWGVYAMNMALNHASHTGRIDSLIVIFQEEIEAYNMPNDLIQILWRIENLKWPNGNDYQGEQLLKNERKRFWKLLFRCIGVQSPECLQ